MSPAMILGLTYVGFSDRGDEGRIFRLVAEAHAKCPPGWQASYTVGSRAPSPEAILVGGARSINQDGDYHIWLTHVDY